jgi:hypothetical protein
MRVRLHRHLVCLSCLLGSLPSVAARAQESQEIYQDFRGGKPLLPTLKLVGPLQDAEITPEDAGLRIALPARRDQHYPVAVATTFSLVGDFEITATYQLLSAKQPAKGYGVGVSLNVATSDAREKFTKVSRLYRAQEGSVYTTEYWNRDPPKEWEAPSVPTEVLSGKLRLIREGDVMRYLVADGPDKEFRELRRRKFGTEDLAHLNLEVCDSGEPGNPVDARLVDLRIRSGKVVAGQAGDVQPASESAGTRGWLTALVVLALVVAASLALGIWLSARRRRSEALNKSRAKEERLS